MVQNKQNLEEMTLRQLRKVASLYNISRYSRMRKSQLLSAIRNIQQTSLNSPTVTSTHSSAIKTEVEASKFEVGQVTSTLEELAAVDVDLPDLPTGYGESRIVLMPRDPQWCYVYWDIPNTQKEEIRRQGGQNLALRIYDVTDINLKHQNPHNVQEYPCDELARDWYIPIPISDRDYLVEIGYRTVDGRWLTLARSGVVRVPPVYPSDWIDDQFVTVGWNQSLAGKSVHQLPNSGQASLEDDMRRRMRELEEVAEAKRVAGSLMRSQDLQPEESLSSYVFPSGVGRWASGMGMSGAGLQMSGAGGQMSGAGMSGTGMQMSGAGGQMSGAGMSGAGMMSGMGMMSGSGMGGNMSGIGMSGVGMMSGSGMGGNMSGIGMSGVGFSASAPPIRPRQFWLVADAELIVYGATEPDATVTIGGQPIKLNPDGTFRFQMSFQDGVIDYPIMAVAADGEQTRAVHMNFERMTPSRQTNTKAEAQLEWFEE